MQEIQSHRLNLKHHVALKMKHFLDNTCIFFFFNLEFSESVFLNSLFYKIPQIFPPFCYRAVRKDTTNMKIACYLFAFCINWKAWRVLCE